MLRGLRGSYGHAGRKKVPRCVNKSFSHRNERIIIMDAAPQNAPVKLARVRKKHQRVDID